MRKIWTKRQLTERAKIFLQASLGEMSVKEACVKLGITRQRYYELEERALAAFLRAVEPQAPGRPPKPKDPSLPLEDRIRELLKEKERLWLYVKVLQGLAGLGPKEKKSGHREKTAARGEPENDR
jgi:hypothetical protein